MNRKLKDLPPSQVQAGCLNNDTKLFKAVFTLLKFSSGYCNLNRFSCVQNFYIKTTSSN